MECWIELSVIELIYCDIIDKKKPANCEVDHIG